MRYTLCTFVFQIAHNDGSSRLGEHLRTCLTDSCSGGRDNPNLLSKAAGIDHVHRLLLEQTSALSQHFGDMLTDCEPPQFLRYKKGDFFVRHQDGNPRQDDFNHLKVRRISIVVFLNGSSGEPQADSYTGGTLNFYDQTKEFGLEGETGLLVAFTADTFHEVIPVTSGERFTIITWFR